MSIAFLVTTLVVVASPGTGVLQTLAAHVISRPRVLAWMRRSFAAAFLGLGAKLAFTER